MFRDCETSAVGRVDADALPVSERPSPAAPSAGTPAALVRRFRFETWFTRDMSHPPCKCSGSSVHVPAEKSYVWFMRHASWNESINSLLHIQFPFILINSAPLRHDHDRSQAGAQ